MAEDLVNGWSCDQRHRGDGCRDPHGCHCREITAQAASLAAKDKEIERLRAENDFVLDALDARTVMHHNVEVECDTLRRQFADLRVTSNYNREAAEQAERALAEAREALLTAARRFELMAAGGVECTNGACPKTGHSEASKAAARAFVAQHGSDSRERK